MQGKIERERGAEGERVEREWEREGGGWKSRERDIDRCRDRPKKGRGAEHETK